MKPIRVAFSGSGFKFPAHVGALLALKEAGFTPIEFAGTSGGSIVAALAACGMPLEDMQHLTLERDWSDMLTFNPWTVLTTHSYCSGDALLKWLTEQTKGLTFAQVPRGLTIMSSSINDSKPFRWSKDTTPDAQVALAARASAAIPIVYAPVIYQGVTHQDGGMANNIPVMRLVKDDIPRLGIELTSKTNILPPGPVSTFALWKRDLEIMLASNESTQVALALSSGAEIAYVETGYADGLDRNMASATRERLLHDGCEATRATIATM